MSLKIDDRIRARVGKLLDQAKEMAQVFALDPSNRPPTRDLIAEGAGWVASALNVLEVVFPNPMTAHRARAQVASMSGETRLRVASLASILKAMLEDVDAGVVASVAESARAEVFDDFLDHAEHYLKGNRIPEAGVIAGVVFEDTIRRMCAKHGVGAPEAKLDLLISELEKASLFTPVKAKRARAAADLRTRASHANWDKFESGDVESCVRLTRELLDSF